MRSRVMTIAVCLGAALGFATLTAAPAQAATGVASSVFSLTNAQRTKAGLKPLITDANLDAAAKAWAQQLANSCTFKHSTASWRTSRTAKAGWTATGENIAAGYTSASAVMSGWMGSAGHKANILNKSYTGLGVGYATGSCGYKTYWVQIFGVGKTAGPAGAGDVNGDFAPDVLALNSAGELLAYRGSGTGSWRGSSVASSGWSRTDRLVTLGDFSGDGISDVGRIRGDGTFQLLKGTATGTYSTPVTIGTGWGALDNVIGGIDFNGDGRTDVLARNASGRLVLYEGDGRSGWRSGAINIGTGWNTLDIFFYAGDFNGDGKGDILARRKSDSALMLYPTRGNGTWGGARQIGWNWGSMTDVLSPGDFDGSGTTDVLARRPDGTLQLYRGNGRGGWGSATTVGTGWSSFAQLG